MFERVLIANRGEIAVRIARTLREMCIRSVLLASYPDRRSLAARTCDEVVVLDGSSAAETYLDIAQVIEAARRTGCGAIHPGYGFLAENADLAAACVAAGITFIGPAPEVLRLLGDKSAARQLAVREGVPVVPGYDAEDTDEALTSAAEAIGYPVMIKARGGGGGRGMRRVHAAEDLADAIASARREAQAAFGDAGLLLERLVEGAHHVEVQILADTQGNVVHLGERECSVQRRHQKLIEEAPSPNVDAALRERLAAAALRIARAAGVVNAATVEFLLIPARDGGEPEFFFMEVNPRLQVEHPVTEEITGIDIVEQQVRVAAGEALGFGPEDITFTGHAIECRINAEDPAQQFRPSVGVIEALGSSVYRDDFGYVAGDIVTAHYDSLLGKIIVHGETRDQVVDETIDSLEGFWSSGPTLNTVLLREIARQPAFTEGQWTIDMLDTRLPEILTHRSAEDIAAYACAAAAWSIEESDLWESQTAAGPRSALPLHGPLGMIESSLGRGESFDERQVMLKSMGDFVARRQAVDASSGSAHWAVTAPSGEAWRFDTIAAWLAGRATVFVSGAEGNPVGAFRLAPPPPSGLRPADVGSAGAARIAAPLSGTIAQVSAEVGQAVEIGDLVVVLEAMKMEHRIEAPAAGVVTQVNVAAGDVVREGDVLVEVGSEKSEG